MSGHDAGRRGTGVLLSLAAAATFGILAPAAKGALTHWAPLRAAGLAYLAAGSVALGAWLLRRAAGAARAGRNVRRRDAWRLGGMTLLGGVAGPALFFAGLSRVAAHEAAVIQHLEFALTVLAAVLVLGERPGRRGVTGLVLVGAGLLLFSWHGGGTSAAAASVAAGWLLLAGACVAWAADNTLARGASDLDPLTVVAIKGLGAGAVLIAISPGGPWRLPASAWLAALLAGGVGVGLSLVLELLALRRIGAALNAGLFATGPAFGFVWSLVFLGERARSLDWVALAACACGAVALAVDSHEHRHVHPARRHAHRHHHLDGHHDHDHGAGFDPAVEHEHEHEHAYVEHAHPHVHDDHHRHRH